MATQDAAHADTREMIMAHTMFRREFGLMPALVRAVADGDLARAEVVARHIELLDSILAHHHHAEDTHLWPRLLDRLPHGETSIVYTMEEQHGSIDKVNAQLGATLGIWRKSADPTHAEALARVLERLFTVMREHLDLEEQSALPLIRRYITAAEWQAMVQDEGADVPPESMALMFGLMMYEADPALIEEIVGGMPGGMGEMLKPMAAEAFATYAQRIHGTATPPRGAVWPDDVAA